MNVGVTSSIKISLRLKAGEEPIDCRFPFVGVKTSWKLVYADATVERSEHLKRISCVFPFRLCYITVQRYKSNKSGAEKRPGGCQSVALGGGA